MMMAVVIDAVLGAVRRLTADLRARITSRRVRVILPLALFVSLLLAGYDSAGRRAVAATVDGAQAAKPVERSQSGPAQSGDSRVRSSSELDALYNRQAEASLGMVAEVLDRLRPQFPEPAERRMAMLLLDGVYHEEGAPRRPAVQAFHQARIAGAAKEISQEWDGDGAAIWKLYDHAFVVRTPTVTLAFDLTRGGSAGAAGFAVADDVMGRIVDKCDVLFISHPHGDHADEWVAGRFIEQGKPVVATDETWADTSFSRKITKLRREAHVRQPLEIQGGRRRLDVVVYPGHQGDLANNVVVVATPEGLSFCHTGDQQNEADFEWIDRISDHHRVDVLMPNCWTRDIPRMVRGVKPALMITGHENELGHPIVQRKAYWQTYDRTAACPCRVLVMTWGESFRYVREKVGRSK